MVVEIKLFKAWIFTENSVNQVPEGVLRYRCYLPDHRGFVREIRYECVAVGRIVQDPPALLLLTFTAGQSHIIFPLLFVSDMVSVKVCVIRVIQVLDFLNIFNVGCPDVHRGFIFLNAASRHDYIWCSVVRVRIIVIKFLVEIGDGATDGVGVGLGAGVTLNVAVGTGVGATDGVALGIGDGVVKGEGAAVGIGTEVGATDGDGVALGTGDGVVEGEGVALGAGVTEGLGLEVGVGTTPAGSQSQRSR